MFSFIFNDSLSLLLSIDNSLFELRLILGGGFEINFLFLFLINNLSFKIKLKIKNSLEKESKIKVKIVPTTSKPSKTPIKFPRVESNCSYFLSKNETLELRTNS